MTSNNDFGSSVCHEPKGIYCHECKEYTSSIEPILIRRYNKQTFAIVTVCKNVILLNNVQCLMIFMKNFHCIILILNYQNFILMKLKIKMALNTN